MYPVFRVCDCFVMFSPRNYLQNGNLHFVLFVVLGLGEDCVKVKDDILDRACDRTDVPEVAEGDEVIDDARVVLVLPARKVLLQTI